MYSGTDSRLPVCVCVCQRCLPGVPDSWNRLLLLLLTEGPAVAKLRSRPVAPPSADGFRVRWEAVTSGFRSKTFAGGVGADQSVQSAGTTQELMQLLYPEARYGAGWV